MPGSNSAPLTSTPLVGAPLIPTHARTRTESCPEMNTALFADTSSSFSKQMSQRASRPATRWLPTGSR
jgi:hypothetical protein